MEGAWVWRVSHLSNSPTMLFMPYSVAHRLTAPANTGATCSKCCSICVIFRVAPAKPEEGKKGQRIHEGVPHQEGEMTDSLSMWS